MRKRVKKVIILAVSYIMGAVFITSLTMIDNDSAIPIILLLISFVWLVLVAIANGWCDDYEI